jgi:ankyrin repeat protein
MAAVNGQFDLALLLLEKGADPNLKSSAGTTPLFAAIERTWAPRASYAHPTENQRQKATHLDLMKALLEAGADPNVRLNKHLWYMEYTFGVLRAAGIDYQGATPFWRAAYALDVDAMRLLKSYGADPGIPTTKPPVRRRRGENDASFGDSVAKPFVSVGHFFHLGNPEVPVGGPHIYPIHAAAGVGYGQSFAGNAHRYVPGNWVPAVTFLVEECGADVNLRDANGYTPLHHAASRGDNDLVLYLVSKGADVKAVSRKGQTTADMANGPIERVSPFPETVALLVKLGAKNNHKCVSC